MNVLSCHGNVLWSGHEDGRLIKWSRNENGMLQKVNERNFNNKCVTMIKCNKHRMYIAVENEVYKVDQVHEANQVDQVNKVNQVNKEKPLWCVRDEVNDIAIQQFTAICDDDGDIRVYSENDSVYKKLKNGHSNICNTVAFRPKCKYEMASGGFDCCLLFWDIAKGKVKCGIDFTPEEEMQMCNPPFVNSIVYAEDGKLVFAGLGNGCIAVVDGNKKVQLNIVKGHNAGISQIGWMDVNCLFSVGNDQKVLIWDLEQLREKDVKAKVEYVHGASINYVVACDGRLYVADVEDQITVYDVYAKKTIQTI